MSGKTRKDGLGRAMLVYALVFLILLGAGIFALLGYLRAYESASAPSAVNAWIGALDDEHAFRLAEPSLAHFDSRICPTQEIFARYAAPLLHEELRAVRDEAGCDAAAERWLLLSGEQIVGSLTLTRGESAAWGLRPWQVSGEELDFSFLPAESDLTVTVPEGFRVECGGYELDESFVTARRAACPELSYLAGTAQEPPELISYTVTDRIGETPLRITDGEGREYPADTDFEELLRGNILNSCSAEERAALEDFAERFCEGYVAFMGCHREKVVSGYRAILPLLLPDSDLAARAANARNGQLWSHNRRNDLVSVEHRAFIRLGEGEYVCDVCFTVDTLGLNGTVRSENRARIFVVERDGQLYATDMLRY